MPVNKLSKILAEEGLLPKLASALIAMDDAPEGDVELGRPLRVRGGRYHSAHYRVSVRGGIYLELYSHSGSPTLYGNLKYENFAAGELSPREVGEEILEDLDDGKLSTPLLAVRWST